MTCSVAECGRPLRARGWCSSHYHRWRRWGDPTANGPRFTPKSCAIDGCDREHHALGWCRLHWRRARDHGDPQADRPLRSTLAADGRRWCPGCSRLLATDRFARNSTRSDGLAGHCRDCQAAYRAINRDRLLAAKRRWYAANVERCRANHARWRKLNQERNRQIATAASMAHSARKAGAVGTASPDQIAARWDFYGGRCWMCGDDATETDHVKPLVKGGSNWPANLRPACKPCNQSKSGRWPFPVAA